MIEKAKAVVTRGKKVLIVRNSGRNYGLPGGELDSGEAPIEGLRREIGEELCTDIVGARPYRTFLYYNGGGERARMHAYRGNLSGTPQLGDLTDMRWVDRNEIEKYPLSPSLEKLKPVLIRGRII